MKIIVAGKTSSGKSTCLQFKSKFKIHRMDEIVKSWYVTNQKLKNQLLEEFGVLVVQDNVVNIEELGKLVWSKKKEMDKLETIITPLVQEYIKAQDDKVDVFEMAAYIGNEKHYRDLVDKVIIITKTKRDISNKFEYMDKKIDPLKNKQIKDFDVEIMNDDTVEECRKAVFKTIKSFK